MPALFPTCLVLETQCTYFISHMDAKATGAQAKDASQSQIGQGSGQGPQKDLNLQMSKA